MLSYRLGEGGEGVRVEVTARLFGVGHDVADGHLAQRREGRRLRRDRRGGRCPREQCLEPPTQRLPDPHVVRATYLSYTLASGPAVVSAASAGPAGAPRGAASAAAAAAALAAAVLTGAASSRASPRYAIAPLESGAYVSTGSPWLGL